MYRHFRQRFQTALPLTIALLLTGLFPRAGSAQEPISAAGNWMWSNISQQRCLQLAGNALRSASSNFELGMSFCERDGWFVVGELPRLRVAIRCIADDDSVNLVSPEATRVLTTVEVTTTRSDLAPRLRNFLTACMRGQACGKPPGQEDGAEEPATGQAEEESADREPQGSR